MIRKSGGFMEHQKEPKGTDLLAKLIELYAEQEGVKITYKLEEVTA